MDYGVPREHSRTLTLVGENSPVVQKRTRRNTLKAAVPFVTLTKRTLYRANGTHTLRQCRYASTVAVSMYMGVFQQSSIGYQWTSIITSTPASFPAESPEKAKAFTLQTPGIWRQNRHLSIFQRQCPVHQRERCAPKHLARGIVAQHQKHLPSTLLHIFAHQKEGYKYTGC